jgi:hypothetical protein
MSRPEPALRPPTQQRLAELFAERAARVRRPPEPSRPGEPETTVLVLLNSLDPPELVDGARRFAAGLSPEEAAAWQTSWTKTRFLFGNPANLTDRTPPRVVARDGSAAWLGPYLDGRLPGPSRLLRPVTGRLPEALVLGPPDRPGATGARELLVAVRDLTLSQYLVHLHHTVAEAVLLGRLTPEEPLRLVHRPDLDTGTAQAEPGYARVHYAAEDRTDLRLYTWLSRGPGPTSSPGSTEVDA